MYKEIYEHLLIFSFIYVADKEVVHHKNSMRTTFSRHAPSGSKAKTPRQVQIKELLSFLRPHILQKNASIVSFPGSPRKKKVLLLVYTSQVSCQLDTNSCLRVCIHVCRHLSVPFEDMMSCKYYPMLGAKI